MTADGVAPPPQQQDGNLGQPSSASIDDKKTLDPVSNKTFSLIRETPQITERKPSRGEAERIQKTTKKEIHLR